MKTRDECKGECGGRWYSVPAGTQVEALKDGRGATVYAVRSAADVERITGDPHLASFYHLWIEQGTPLASDQAACNDCGNNTPIVELDANGGVCDLCERAQRERDIARGKVD